MPKPKPTVTKLRMNVDVHPEVKAQIQDIQERTRADSMSEVLRRAVQLYDVLLQAQEANGTIVINPKQGVPREVVLF